MWIIESIQLERPLHQLTLGLVMNLVDVLDAQGPFAIRVLAPMPNGREFPVGIGRMLGLSLIDGGDIRMCASLQHRHNVGFTVQSLACRAVCVCVCVCVCVYLFTCWGIPD
jgi:hypothetical protein